MSHNCNQERKHESTQSRVSFTAPRTVVAIAEEDRPTQKIRDYISQMQKDLDALKSKLEQGTDGTHASRDGKARLETCVMSCVATFVFGEADRHVPKKYELKLTCGDQQSSTNGPSVEMNYIQNDMPNRRTHIPQLGAYSEVESKTLAVVINGAKEAIDKGLEKTVGNRGKGKIKG